MLKAIVYSAGGEKATDVQLSDKVFAVKVSPDLIHQAVVAELSNLRNSVAHTKTRGEVRGGGKKPWKQKGTGRARAGSIRSPLWKGGGVTFGPRSARNFSKALNRPQFRRSLLATLSDKFIAKNLYVIERLNVDSISTKKLNSALSELRGKLALNQAGLNIVIPARDKNLEYSARNLQDVAILRVSEITPYKLLKEQVTLVYKDALPVIEKTFVKS